MDLLRHDAAQLLADEASSQLLREGREDRSEESYEQIPEGNRAVDAGKVRRSTSSVERLESLGSKRGAYSYYDWKNMQEAREEGLGAAAFQ